VTMDDVELDLVGLGGCTIGAGDRGGARRGVACFSTGGTEPVVGVGVGVG